MQLTRRPPRINSWQPDLNNPFVKGWPHGLAWSADIKTNFGTFGVFSTTSPYGVYQSLSTRNAGEIIRAINSDLFAAVNPRRAA